MFLDILQNSQEVTCSRVSFFNKDAGLTTILLKKRLVQVACGFGEISKNNFFTEHLQTTTSLLGFVAPVHERINESSPCLMWRLFLWCETAVFLLPIGYMTQIMPRREKRLKKASKGCHSITQLFSLHQNNPESSTSMEPPVNEPAPENQQNEPETPQPESTITIDGDNAPTKTFQAIMKLMLSNLNLIHLRHTYFQKQKLVAENAY